MYSCFTHKHKIHKAKQEGEVILMQQANCFCAGRKNVLKRAKNDGNSMRTKQDNNKVCTKTTGSGVDY